MKTDHMSAIMEGVEDGQAGENGAINMSEATDVFQAYIGNIIQTLQVEFEADEDTLLAVIMDVADELFENGDMPEYPDEDSTDEDFILWLGTAESLGFHGYVLKAVRDQAEDMDESDE
jgi:hypothetical protein